MASLALLVVIIFSSVILTGPFVYFLSWTKLIHKSIIFFTSAFCFLIGVYWISLPIWPINFLGIIPVLFSIWSVKNSK